jgi:hypothetical protein
MIVINGNIIREAHARCLNVVTMQIEMHGDVSVTIKCRTGLKVIGLTFVFTIAIQQLPPSIL